MFPLDDPISLPMTNKWEPYKRTVPKCKNKTQVASVQLGRSLDFLVFPPRPLRHMVKYGGWDRKRGLGVHFLALE